MAPRVPGAAGHAGSAVALAAGLANHRRGFFEVVRYRVAHGRTAVWHRRIGIRAGIEQPVLDPKDFADLDLDPAVWKANMPATPDTTERR